MNTTQYATTLRVLVAEESLRIQSIPESQLCAKPNPEKWSQKEILGHLIDSAHTNLRRFMEIPQHPGVRLRYDQDHWVAASGYQQWPTADVITLWRLMNLQIASVAERLSPEDLNQEGDSGKDAPSLETVAWLLEDYLRHMKHHLAQLGGWDS